MLHAANCSNSTPRKWYENKEIQKLTFLLSKLQRVFLKVYMGKLQSPSAKVEPEIDVGYMDIQGEKTRMDDEIEWQLGR
jgi:hypothetical protein